jgi:hypothetical protein
MVVTLNYVMKWACSKDGGNTHGHNFSAKSSHNAKTGSTCLDLCMWTRARMLCNTNVTPWSPRPSWCASTLGKRKGRKDSYRNGVRKYELECVFELGGGAFVVTCYFLTLYVLLQVQWAARNNFCCDRSGWLPLMPTLYFKYFCSKCHGHT